MENEIEGKEEDEDIFSYEKFQEMILTIKILKDQQEMLTMQNSEMAEQIRDFVNKKKYQ